MSGGVDSSVAALLIKKQCYNAIGVFMRSYNLDGCEESDAEDARRVAGKLGIPFYVWDFEKEYKKRVVDYMVEGYRRGLTPNPDVMCNKEIKFGLFLGKALKFGADYVATGHYVRIVRNVRSVRNDKKHIEQAKRSNKRSNRTFELFVANDKNKDQSYFLWTLTQEQLKHCLFPVGDYQKSEVRKMAKKAGLPTAEKKDSQGICFLGKVTLTDFLENYIPARKGAVLNIAGEAIGKHSGAQFYTIGQRHIGMANRRPTETERGLTRKTNFEPLYVAQKDIRSNTLVVAEGSDNSALFQKEVELAEMNFINPETHSLIRANERMMVLARVRYRQPLFKATLSLINRRTVNTKKGLRQSASSLRQSALLVFEQKQKFVAPGQSAVFYTKAGKMLGGGIIV